LCAARIWILSGELRWRARERVNMIKAWYTHM
jgi:hypothetical protein